MSQFQATCKFCKRNLILIIDEAYPAQLDPYRLISLAACDHCADLRVTRRRLEARLQKICSNLAACPVTKLAERGQEVKDTLTKLTKEYASMIAKFNGMSGMMWDEEFVNLLLEKPGQWADILTRCWRMFKDYANRPKPETPPPYADE